MLVKRLGAAWLIVAAAVRAAAVTSGTMTALRSAIRENDWETAATLTPASASLDGAERAALLQELEAMTTRVRAGARGVEAAAKRGSANGAGSYLRSISPAYQWAQNSTACFLEVKYAAKWGAPAATGAKIDAVDFTNSDDENGHSILRVKATTPEQVFELDLALYGALDLEKSSWNTGSVGRVNVVLFKATAGHWSKLSAGKAPPNAKFWFELQESLSYDSSWMRSNEETSRPKNEFNPSLAAPIQPASKSTAAVASADLDKTAKTGATSEEASKELASKPASSSAEIVLSINEALEVDLAAAVKRAEAARTAANRTYAAARNDTTAATKHRKEVARAVAAAKRHIARQPPRWLLGWLSTSFGMSSSTAKTSTIAKSPSEPSTIGAWAARRAVQSPIAWPFVLWVERVRGSAIAVEYEKKVNGGPKKGSKTAATRTETLSSTTSMMSPQTGQFILMGVLWLTVSLGMYGCIELTYLAWLTTKVHSKPKDNGKVAMNKGPKKVGAVPTSSWWSLSLQGAHPCSFYTPRSCNEYFFLRA